MSFSRANGVARLFFGVIAIDVSSEYVPWYYKSLGYYLRLEMESFPFLTDQRLYNHDRNVRDTKDNGSGKDNSMDHGKGCDPLIRLVGLVRW